jgi:hypothetical protein
MEFYFFQIKKKGINFLNLKKKFILSMWKLTLGNSNQVFYTNFDYKSLDGSLLLKRAKRKST